MDSLTVNVNIIYSHAWSHGSVACQRPLKLERLAVLNVTLPLSPQPPLRHHPPFPVVPQDFDFLLLLLRQLQQAKPLGDPVRGDAVPLTELNPGEVAKEHFIMEFSGENEWIPVGSSACTGNVRAADQLQFRDLRF